MREIPVLITIQSNAHRDDEEEEPVRLITSGFLTLDQDKATLLYEESLDESLPPQKVIVTIENETMTVSRAGAYATQMVFHKGRRYEGIYETPFGSMDLAIYCTRLRCELDLEGGEILLSYQMDLNGQFAAMHEMEMRLITQNG